VTPPAAPTPLIDWHALGQVLLTSVVLGVGIVVLFSVCVHSLSQFRRVGATVAVRATNAVVMTATLAAIAASVVWGLYIIVHK
jgi:hypothetical protein